MILLILQRIFGPKFFVPAKFIKNYHNYFIKPSKLSELNINETECTICFGDINTEIDVSEKNEKNLIEKKAKKIMITPCKHIFHVYCLSSWMQQKLVCPNCRAKLPCF